MNLSQLSVPKGARKKRKTVGRGEGSGHGKTSCKGGKGQTARSGGKIRAGFEGGQMPLYRRIPKLGFVSGVKVSGSNQYMTVGLSILERFENGSTVDAETLSAKGYKAKAKERAGVKVLGSGKLSKKLTVKVSAITETARQQIEACGGKVEIVGKSSVSKQS
jgi:large subunit ribosomal protein L15